MTTAKGIACLFQTVDEHPEPIDAEIKGEIPPWLNGTLLRNGPGKFECGDIPFNHWFDGQALLHRFQIKDGHVTYGNRFIRGESYADSLKHGSANHLEFGTFIPPDPCQNIFSRFFSKFWHGYVPLDNTNVNIFAMKDKLYAATEANFLHEFDPQSLETLNRVDLTTEFPGDARIDIATAHPQITRDGSVLNVSIQFGAHATYNIVQIPPSSGKSDEKPLDGGKVLCSIRPTSGLGYMHSFILTEHYLVLTETPLSWNILRILTTKLFESSVVDWLHWDPNQLSRFLVIDRKEGTHVGVFTAEPFFVFHHINAFEKNGKIHLDACCYPDSQIIDDLYLHNVRTSKESAKKNVALAEVRRYELPLEELGNVKEGKSLVKRADGLDYILLNAGLELPQFNYTEKNGKEYEFVYGIGTKKFVFDHLIKVNVETKEYITWEEPEGFTSEPVFVKRPDGKDEDDGVVLSSVINTRDQTTSLLVLDAKDFKELGRAVVNGVTPMNLHGLFKK